MLLKPGMASALILLLAPHEPNLGLGRTSLFAELPVASLLRTRVIDGLGRVKAEIEAAKSPVAALRSAKALDSGFRVPRARERRARRLTAARRA